MAFDFDTPRRRETLAAIAAAVLPVGTPGDFVEAVVAEIVDELAQTPPERAKKLAQLVDLLDRPTAVRLLGGRRAAVRSQSRDEVERLLLAMATHRLATVRAGFQALRKGVSFIGYGRSDASGNPLWKAMAYPGPRDDRPKSAPYPIEVVDASKCPDEADVVVVGSGAGGSVAAAVFAEAGRSVVVLEEGEAQPPSAVDQRELASFRKLFLERGGAASDDMSIGLLSGRGVGGGTIVNWNVSLRLDGEVAREWDEASHLRGLTRSLQGHYDAVERRLGLATSADNGNNGILRAGCEALHWPVRALLRNAEGCGAGCGYCTFGCAYGKKHDTPRSLLRDACAAGAIVVAGANVERVLFEGERAVGVEMTDRSGALRTIRGKLVVAAAGAMRTPKLLLRSGIRSRALGRSLYLHPTTPVHGVFDHDVDPWLGAPMTAMSKRFAHLDGPYGFVLECAPVHPGLASVAIPWFGAQQHADALAALKRTSNVIAITRDRDPGRVDDADVPNVRYRLSRFDGRHLVIGMISAARALFAAGAREVYTAHTPPLRLSRDDATEAGMRRFGERIVRAGHAPNRVALFSAHQMGTARMSAYSREGVVDERGAVYGRRGLIVCDGSTFPRASGVNPMLTIMAMAHRIAALHS